MAKLKPNEKRVQLSFVRPGDVALFEWMTKQAYDRRLTISDFILLALGEAFAGQYEQCNIAPEAVVTEPIPETPDFVHAPISIDLNPPSEEQLSRDMYEHGKPQPEPEPSDDGYEATKAAIAQNNQLYAINRGKGSIPLPGTVPASLPVPPELASSTLPAKGTRRGQSRRS